MPEFLSLSLLLIGKSRGVITQSLYFDGYVVSYMEKAVKNILCPLFSPYWGVAVNGKESKKNWKYKFWKIKSLWNCEFLLCQEVKTQNIVYKSVFLL